MKEYVVMLHQTGLKCDGEDKLFPLPRLKEVYYFDVRASALARIKSFPKQPRIGIYTITLYQMSETKLLSAPFSDSDAIQAAVKAFEESHPE